LRFVPKRSRAGDDIVCVIVRGTTRTNIGGPVGHAGSNRRNTAGRIGVGSPCIHAGAVGQHGR